MSYFPEVMSRQSWLQQHTLAREVSLSINDLTERIIGAAIDVHRELGPGLLESTYEACLLYELTRRGLNVEQQKAMPVVYWNARIDCGYRLDLLVERKVIIELKAVERLDPIHMAQVMTYLKLSGCHVGLLMNFNVQYLKNGVHRIVVGRPDSPPCPPCSLW